MKKRLKRPAKRFFGTNRPCYSASMETESREIEHIYTDLWNQSIDRFTANQCETDPLIQRTDDSRRGLTLLVRPDHLIASGIEQFLNEVKRLEPNQYFYPRSDLHLTILSIISCRENFQPDASRNAEYKEIIKDCIRTVGPPEIRFTGITASPACLMIQGFPLNDNLHKLRENLRNQFRRSGLPHSIDSRYPIRTAHLTVLRFKEPLRHASELIRLLKQYREHEFGTQTFGNCEFVFNDWYQRSRLTNTLGSFVISPNH